MELQLKNIGMIKEANVKIDGLTVIAGENDTGKSTVGKALFLYLYRNKAYIKFPTLWKIIFGENIYHKNTFLSCSGNVGIDTPIFVETPIVWNFNKFFNQMSTIESQLHLLGNSLNIDYPFLFKDLNFRLSVGINNESYHIENIIFPIINGKFKKDNFGNFFFERDNIKIPLLTTATGIKYFGILQVLSENNWLNKTTVLILDEPEVHLHPKWQLEMAKIIVELVKNGVKILVNSHSPYMIEALKRYSELSEIEDKTNFYLAENGYIEQQDSLENIFEKLVLPLRELKKIKMEKYLND